MKATVRVILYQIKELEVSDSMVLKLLLSQLFEVSILWPLVIPIEAREIFQIILGLIYFFKSRAAALDKFINSSNKILKSLFKNLRLFDCFFVFLSHWRYQVLYLVHHLVLQNRNCRVALRIPYLLLLHQLHLIRHQSFAKSLLKLFLDPLHLVQINYVLINVDLKLCLLHNQLFHSVHETQKTINAVFLRIEARRLCFVVELFI